VAEPPNAAPRTFVKRCLRRAPKPAPFHACNVRVSGRPPPAALHVIVICRRVAVVLVVELAGCICSVHACEQRQRMVWRSAWAKQVVQSKVCFKCRCCRYAEEGRNRRKVAGGSRGNAGQAIVNKHGNGVKGKARRKQSPFTRGPACKARQPRRSAWHGVRTHPSFTAFRVRAARSLQTTLLK